MEKENFLQKLRSLDRPLKYVLGLICLLISMQTHLEAVTIQSLVNAAPPDSTVLVPPGIYVEQVVINKNLTLQGSGVGVTIIQCPGIMTNSFLYTTTGVTYVPIVMVEGANVSSVNIQDLTVDGLGLGASNVRFTGLGYHNGGGIIQNVDVTNIRDNVSSGSQSGNAILDAIDDGNSYSMSVLNSTLTNFQKGGIVVRGSILSVNISGNTITGNNPFIIGQAASNGIQLSNSAIGTITNNTISKCLSGNLPAGEGSGILLFEAGTNIVVQNNTVTDNDLGIASVNTGGPLNISNNQVNVNNDIGIYIQDTVGLTTLTSNTMQNNTNQNMQLFDSGTSSVPPGVFDAPFNLANNIFVGSNVGLFVEGDPNTGTTGPIVHMDHDSFTGSTQYYIQEMSAPHDIWPSTATVSFDGLVSGQITFAQFNQILTKIFDKHNDPALGLVLDFISPISISKSFSPSSIREKSISKLTITLFNRSNTIATLTAPLMDTLPAGVTVSGMASTTCGGIVTVTNSNTTITMTGGSIPANGSCFIAVEVFAKNSGFYTNTLPAGALVTSEGDNQEAAIAVLMVIKRKRGGGSGGGASLWPLFLPPLLHVPGPVVILPIPEETVTVDGEVGNLEDCTDQTSNIAPQPPLLTEPNENPSGCSTAKPDLSISALALLLLYFMRRRQARLKIMGPASGLA